jgi:hypothetical protein
MNKNGERVNRVQLKENERCLRGFQREKLVAPMTFDVCSTTAYRRDRVQRAKEKTVTREGRRCDPLDPPPFAYTGSATVNPAAVNGALALIHEIFGAPVLDADLVTRDADSETARCQLEMLRLADRLENIIGNEVNRAKRQALRDQTVNSGPALEAKLQDVLTANDRITRAEDRLVTKVDKRCAALQAPDTIFPGACRDPDLSLVEACVIAAARCEACLKIEAFDALDLDCDQADDQDNTNGSCP